MFHRILVPLDGSDLAEAVLPQVEQIASRFGSEVILLQVVPTLTELTVQTNPAGAILTPTATEVSMDAAKAQHESEHGQAGRYLDATSEKLVASGINTQVEIREGGAAEVIRESAIDLSCDVIAISTNGRSGLSRTVFGSVTDDVMRNSSVPLLVVRPGDQL